MTEHHEKISTYLFYFLVVVESIIVIALCFKPHINISFENEPFYSLNEGWTYVDDYGTKHLISLPAVLDSGKDKTVTISRKLPDNIPHLTAISLLSTHQNIYAYINNELIYSQVNNNRSKLFRLPAGSIWDIIPLPNHSEGKILTLKVTSEYDKYTGRINSIHAGTKSALLIHNLYNDGFSLVIAFLTFVCGIIIILIYLFLNRLITISRSVFYLGWFSIFISIWMIMESNLTQIFMSNEYVISALTYLSLMTFPIPLILYISLFENYHYKKIIHCVCFIFLGSAFLLILLQLFNIMDFHESVVIEQAEIVLLFCLVLITLILELFRYKNKELRVFTISSFILFIFGFTELLTYDLRAGRNDGFILQTGFLIFISILLWSSLKKVADIIKLSESATHYKFLATRDLLTNCRNRISYSKDLDRISLDRNITIFVADMNNMKAINDTYGHHAGDEAIIQCSQCLLKIFGHRVYRIGGDEFVCIGYDLTPELIQSMLSEFHLECKKVNEDFPYGIQMSVGYAGYDKTMDKTIYDTVKRADKDMYSHKMIMKTS